MRGELGAQALTAEAANQAQASLPSKREAMRLFAESRAKIVNLDYLGARDLLIKAVPAEPENAAIHGALADAWAALGYTATAQEEAKRALDLSSSLSREEQLLIEGRYRQLAHDWPKAVETYRALTRFFPDNLDYGLRLAAVLSKEGKEQESLQALEALRRLPKPIANDPRIDLQEALTFSTAADYKGVKTAAADAADKAQKRGTHMLLAEAKLLQSQAATRQDDPRRRWRWMKKPRQFWNRLGTDMASRAPAIAWAISSGIRESSRSRMPSWNRPCVTSGLLETRDI